MLHGMKGFAAVSQVRAAGVFVAVALVRSVATF
jgi:hypothetical protein